MLFLTLNVLVANPTKPTLHGGQSCYRYRISKNDSIKGRGFSESKNMKTKQSEGNTRERQHDIRPEDTS